MRLAALLHTSLFALALAAPAQKLTKRCRVSRDVMACWVAWDLSECVAYIPLNVTYEFDDANKKVIIRGLCESCSQALALERAASWDEYSKWSSSFGEVQDLGNGTFVITDIGKDYFDLFRGMEPTPWGRTSCYSLDEYEWDYE
ncbi:hypothetical protein QC763_602220 [Podospora pseudopauciseta]|uniref:Cyanovirin-N domain-containing protein n=1 Tax=Podospora pseudopauciseta TaxID=2093780 RepID=A0ABR0H4E7_9PEZI|nr:hypothetical protein QC763_602220 [Podospora pseudopauciseta]